MVALLNDPDIDSSDARRLERESGVEFVDGQIVEKSMSVESSLVESRILFRFNTVAMRDPVVAVVFPSSMGYRVYPEDPKKHRKPDVSVVRIERMKGIDISDGYMTIPADLAIEVVSPHDLHYEVTEKVEEYLQHGFPLVWVVNPRTRTVQICRADGSLSQLHENDEITVDELLPGFKCLVKDFFPARLPVG